MENIDEYLSGQKLYGDDFSVEQIKKWNEEESEASSDLRNKSNIETRTESSYHYNMMNKIHGFDKIKGLKKTTFYDVLGFGAAFGFEFGLIIDKINNLTIVEPSDNLVSKKLGNLTPKYIKPNEDNSLSIADNSFDLITSFGTLHHIPNVSFVLKELIRVLKPNGYLLLREPINSMGDWREPRVGLTKNERGVPVKFFDSVFKESSVKIVSKEYCFAANYSIEKRFGKFFKKPLYSYKFYVLLDKYLSFLLQGNIHYYSTKPIDNICPTSIFYVIKKC